MSYAQASVAKQESWWSRAAVSREFSITAWRDQRHAGRARIVRRVAVVASLYPAIMMGTQALVLLAAGLPASLIVTPGYLRWAVPIMIAFPIAVFLAARSVWDANERRYHLEKAKMGERPTPLMNESIVG